MSTSKRGKATRPRGWGQGPKTLRFEPLEGRQLLSSGTTDTASTVTTTTLQPLMVQTAFSTPSTLEWGNVFQATGTIENKGSGPNQTPIQVDVYASNGPSVDGNSVLLGTITIPSGLGVGQTYSYSQQMQMPLLQLTGSTTNQVYLDARVDMGSGPDLTSTPLGQGVDQTLVTIAPTAPANLVPTLFSLGSQSSTWGAAVSYMLQIQNQGQGSASGNHRRTDAYAFDRHAGNGQRFRDRPGVRAGSRRRTNCDRQSTDNLTHHDPQGPEWEHPVHAFVSAGCELYNEPMVSPASSIWRGNGRAKP